MMNLLLKRNRLRSKEGEADKKTASGIGKK
jgi:hypothetical protein